MDDLPPADLFSIDAKQMIDQLEVTSTERMVRDYWIIINGKKFNAEDVYETLRETCDDSSDSYINNPRMVEALRSLRVIEHGGHRSGMTPEKGPNYDYFMSQLKAKLKPARG